MGAGTGRALQLVLGVLLLVALAPLLIAYCVFSALFLKPELD